jgi:hypothetical protein
MRRLFDFVSTFCENAWLETYIDKRLTDLESANVADKKSERWTIDHDFWRLRKFFICKQPDKKTIEWLSENKERLLLIEEIAGKLYREDYAGWRDLSASKIEIIMNEYVELWPKVNLPSSWGSGDPPEQIAYRFLTEVIWLIGRDTPKNAIDVLTRLIADPRLVDFVNSLKAIKANSLKQLALEDFKPPTPEDMTQMLDNQKVASVEDMRALLVEIFVEIQDWLKGSETDPINLFYDKQRDSKFVRKGENEATKIIADSLKLRCEK